MKQYCPQCDQWHEEYTTRTCSQCQSIMYTKSAYEKHIKNHWKFKIMNHKKLNQLKTVGTIMTFTGVVLFILGIIGINIFTVDEMLFRVLSIVLLPIGFVLFCFGLNNLGERTRFLKSSYDELYSPTQTVSRPSNQPVIICPYCKSQNTVKLDALDRMGSILLVGVASGKLGKQWHCKDCKSDF